MYLFDYGKSLIKNFPDKTALDLFSEMLDITIFDRNGKKTFATNFRNSFLFPSAGNAKLNPKDIIDKISNAKVTDSNYSNPFYYDKFNTLSSYNVRTIGKQYSIPTDTEDLILSYIGHAITVTISDAVNIRMNDPNINKILWDGISVYKDYLLGNVVRKSNQLATFLGHYLVYAINMLVENKPITNLDKIRFLSDFERSEYIFEGKNENKGNVLIDNIDWQTFIISLCKYYIHTNSEIEKIYLNCESQDYKSKKITYGLIPVYIKNIQTLKELYSSDYFEQKGINKKTLKLIWDANRLSDVLSHRQIGVNSLIPVLPYSILKTIDFKKKNKNKFEKEISDYNIYLKEYIKMALGTDTYELIKNINDILKKYNNVKNHAIDAVFKSNTVSQLIESINQFIVLSKNMTDDEKTTINNFVLNISKNSQEFRTIKSILKNYYLTTN